MEWIKETGKNYIAFIEGVYYKVNNAIIYRIDKREVVLRNAWTGKEQILKQGINEKEAIKFIKEFIKTDFERI